MPNCKKKARALHHIQRWADCPQLRYKADNCISLCIEHHQKVTGHEEIYASLFKSLISGPTDVEIIKAKYGITDE